MPDLSFDVLCLICRFLPNVRDVLSLSLTCSTLHSVAVERRLSMRPVTIDSVKSVRDFHNFLFVDEKLRGKHVRAITIPRPIHGESPDSSEELLHRLLAIFESVPRSHTLSLWVPPSLYFESNSPVLLFRHPRFLAAVANMDSLQHLSVFGSLPIAADLLGSTRSSLRTFQEGSTYSALSLPSFPVKAAPQLTSTLRSVEFDFEFFAGVAMASPSQAFPNVHIVRLINISKPFGQGRLFKLFPNLQTLILRTRTANSLDADVAGLETARQTSQEAAKKAPTWLTLDHVAGIPAILFALGLACPVRRLTLDVMRESDPWLDLDSRVRRVRTVLEDCTPTHLSLVNVQLCHLGFSLLGNPVFHDSDTSRLSHLVLAATYQSLLAPDLKPVNNTARAPRSSWDLILDTLLNGKFTALTHLRVVIKCDIDLDRPFSHPTYDGARHFKFDRLLSTPPSIIPSLLYVCITSFGSAKRGTGTEEARWKTTRAWRVRRQAPTGTSSATFETEQISAGDAEAAIEKEEMYGDAP